MLWIEAEGDTVQVISLCLSEVDALAMKPVVTAKMRIENTPVAVDHKVWVVWVFKGFANAVSLGSTDGLFGWSPFILSLLWFRFWIFIFCDPYNKIDENLCQEQQVEHDGEPAQIETNQSLVTCPGVTERRNDSGIQFIRRFELVSPVKENSFSVAK